jgi:hypothetical protein
MKRTFALMVVVFALAVAPFRAEAQAPSYCPS